MTVFDKISFFKKKENENKNLQGISLIIFWDFSMFYQTFLSTHVKRSTSIAYKHGI